MAVRYDNEFRSLCAVAKGGKSFDSFLQYRVPSST